MLCPTALKSLLNQANTRGVDSTLLISRDGSVMAHSGNTTERHALVTAAVASNVWGAYEKAGRSANLTMSPAKTANRRNYENGNAGGASENTWRNLPMTWFIYYDSSIIYVYYVYYIWPCTRLLLITRIYSVDIRACYRTLLRSHYGVIPVKKLCEFFLIMTSIGFGNLKTLNMKC